MDTILKTTLLEFEKSAFVIDLVQRDNGKQYISILQTIEDDRSEHNRAIKINPSLLGEVVNVLNSYNDLIPDTENQAARRAETTVLNQGGLTDHQKIELQSRYLKGVRVSDLAMQFDCKEDLVEEILRNRGVSIVNNKAPRVAYFWKHKSKKR